MYPPHDQGAQTIVGNDRSLPLTGWASAGPHSPELQKHFVGRSLDSTRSPAEILTNAHRSVPSYPFALHSRAHRPPPTVPLKQHVQRPRPSWNCSERRWSGIRGVSTTTGVVARVALSLPGGSHILVHHTLHLFSQSHFPPRQLLSRSLWTYIVEIYSRSVAEDTCDTCSMHQRWAHSNRAKVVDVLFRSSQ